MDLDRNSFAAALAHERGFVVVSPTEALIPLQHRKGPVVDHARVSREDRYLGRHSWSRNLHGYPRRRSKDGTATFLHREIMGCTVGDETIVDHINRDRADARRENLRFTTQAENSQNQGARPHLTSRHRGVSLRKRTGKWTANHKLNGVYHHLGEFATEDEANEAAVAWRAEHMPYAGDTSKHRGVSWDKDRGKWKAQGRIHGGTNVLIGRFDDELVAAEAARAWRAENMPGAID